MSNLLAAFIGEGESDMVTAPFCNEHQRSVNDFWLCIMGYLSGDWLQTSINDILAAFRG